MSTRYLVAQQLGSTLRLPFADLERLDEVFGSARIDGVESIVLNPCSEHPQTFVPEQRSCRFKTVERFIDARRSRAHMCECDRCGYRCARGFIQDERFKYCPNCGRRIEADE